MIEFHIEKVDRNFFAEQTVKEIQWNGKRIGIKEAKLDILTKIGEIK